MSLLVWFLIINLLTIGVRGQGDDDDEDVVYDESVSSQFEDTPITTQLWRLIHEGNIDGLHRFASENPKWVHLRSADGRGALFWAFEYQQSEILSMLINAGVDTEVTDRNGAKPRDLAPSGFEFTHDPNLKFVYIEPVAQPTMFDDEEEDEDDSYFQPKAQFDYEDDDDDF
eukprot:NODE_5097_length_719_cov_23.653731_g4731_i0.p1 GENE.NODE_5097_length_719_cov_23.653731_g4731_i0~~NODE_5097_length_719_cov_23.653731_g4731_i0.p1  ORF type:complete len:171 (+),score=43.14 NODE_5097_length_719_cov_23.653731_g4731_i0:115-627(+)